MLERHATALLIQVQPGEQLGKGLLREILLGRPRRQMAAHHADHLRVQGLHQRPRRLGIARPRNWSRVAAAAVEFEVSPGAKEQPVQAEFKFEHDVLVYEFSPHMHLRGSSVICPVQYPDGRSETLLNVPNYDLNWQALHRRKTPKRIPAGTRLVCSGTFDNSAGNPANPHPKATVHFGAQTADEMFTGYFNYSAIPAPHPTTAWAGL